MDKIETKEMEGEFEGHTPGKRCKMNGEEINLCHIIEGNEALDYEGKCYGCGAKRAIVFDKENQVEADAARAYLIKEGLDPDQLVKEGLVFIKAIQENIQLRSELQKAKQEIANHIATNSLLFDSDREAQQLKEYKEKLKEKLQFLKSGNHVIGIDFLFELIDQTDSTK